MIGEEIFDFAENVRRWEDCEQRGLFKPGRTKELKRRYWELLNTTYEKEISFDGSKYLKEYYTAKECAEICKVAYSTFLRWCKEGIITDCELTNENRSGLGAYVIGKNFKVKLPYTEETLKRAVAR